MAKFEAAEKRRFRNIYVDKVTKRKIRAPPLKVIAGEIKSRGNRGTRKLRPLKKK